MKSKLHMVHPYHTNYIPKLLFFVSVILSIITTYYVSAHYIDSDTSSELVLARHLIETRNLLSSDWFYATEIRLFHVQWIYVPLMLLLDDWFLVRYIGALIMQALYLTSFACLVYAAGKSKNFFFYGAALLLLPVSVSYGRIVLYHNHYILHISISFFLLALSMHFTDAVNWRSRKTWLHLFILAVLSFVSGLNSIRQLMITHAPLLLMVILLCWVEDIKCTDHSKPAFLEPANLNFLICTVCTALFSFAGLKTQSFLINKLGLHIRSQAETNILSFVGFDHIKDILYGFFHQFGYRKDAPMLTVPGILGLGSIFAGTYLIIISIKQLLQNKPHRNRREVLLSLFFFVHTSVMLLIFLITSNSGDYSYPLYLSLCFPWAVPLLLNHFEEFPPSVHPLHFKKLFAAFAIVILLFSGIVNYSYFQGSNRFPQTYEGINFLNKDVKENLSEVVNLLTEQGYDKGYASYWSCNIVTEMTNGDMTMVLIRDPDKNKAGNLSYRNWLTTIWSREAPCEKPFLLLEKKWATVFPQSDSYVYCTQIYSGDNYIAYSIDDLEGFIKTLYV